MNTIDPNLEYQRLAEVYREKSDDELELIAAQAYELTDVAQQALNAEIATRGLPLQLQAEPSLTVDEEDDEEELPLWNEDGRDLDADFDLRVLMTVWSRDEAMAIEKGLEESGIAHFFGNENFDEVEQVTAPFDRGVPVKVRYVDMRRAMSVLKSLDTENPASLEEEPSDAPAVLCPRCKSDEVVLRSVKNANGSVLDSIFRWRCDSCGNAWEDDGVERG